MQSIFEAVVDPRRRQMIEWVKARPRIEIGRLSAQFDLSRPAVSHHLDKLESAGMVLRQRDGRSVRLLADLEPLRSLRRRWLDRLVDVEPEDPASAPASAGTVIFVRAVAADAWRQGARRAVEGEVLTREVFGLRILSLHGEEIDSLDLRLRMVVVLPDGKMHDAEILSAVFSPSVVRAEWKNVSPVRRMDEQRLGEAAAWWLAELSEAAHAC